MRDVSEALDDFDHLTEEDRQAALAFLRLIEEEKKGAA